MKKIIVLLLLLFLGLVYALPVSSYADSAGKSEVSILFDGWAEEPLQSTEESGEKKTENESSVISKNAGGSFLKSGDTVQLGIKLIGFLIIILTSILYLLLKMEKQSSAGGEA
ncbi:hypothetical protein ACYSNR_16420 [Enterococcus sp. LJL128]